MFAGLKMSLHTIGESTKYSDFFLIVYKRKFFSPANIDITIFKNTHSKRGQANEYAYRDFR